MKDERDGGGKGFPNPFITLRFWPAADLEHWSLGMSVTSLVIVPLQLVNGQAKRGGTHSLELEAAQILVNCSPSADFDLKTESCKRTP